MMKNLFYVIGLTFVLVSCFKQEFKPQQPIMVPTITPSPTPIQDTTYSMVGQTWVITKVLNTDFDDEVRSDTLVFTTNNTYSFNGLQSTYGIYTNNSNFTLTLNSTPWGHISGSIYDNNLTQGIIINCQFKNYLTGQNVVRLWMYKQ